MSHKANLVVFQAGSWRLYYSRWAAYRLDVDLFWGPEPAQQFIEGHWEEPCWVNWCEGAVVLDIHNRVLLFFGGQDMLNRLFWRRAFLPLMATNWPGWDIRWAHEGAMSIADYLKLDKTQLLAERNDHVSRKIRIAEDPKFNMTLLTVVRAGQCAAFQVCGGIASIRNGPAALETVPAAPAIAPFTWYGRFPSDGLHVDFDQCTLAFWSVAPVPYVKEIKAVWPGWETTWLGDIFESHIALSKLDIKLPYGSDTLGYDNPSCRSEAEWQKEIIQYLRHMVSDPEPLAILDSISQRLPIA